MKEELKEYIKNFHDTKDRADWADPFKAGVNHVLGCIEMKITELEWDNKDDWNNAVEASAKIVDDCNREGPYNAIAAAPRIRELKK